MATTTAKRRPVKKTVKSVTKKPTTKSASSAKKTTSKKITITKTSTKKTAFSKKSSVAKRTPVTPFEKIRGLHFSNVFSGVVLAVLTLVFVNPQIKELLLGYQARDSFVNSDVVNLGSASEVLFSIDIRYILVVFLGLTALVSLLLATKLLTRYENTVKAGISGMRWLLYGIVSAIVVDFVSLMAGVSDLMTLKAVGGLVILGALFAWMFERENAGKEKKTTHKLAFYSAILAYVLAVIPMLVSLIATSVIGAQRFSWYVYALVAVIIFGSVATLLTMKSSINNKDKYEYVTFEQRYIRIDQIVKFVIVLCIFAAFNK